MKVLLYVDGSDSSYRAADRARQMAGEGASVTTLFVYPPRLDRDSVSQFELEPHDLDLKFGEEVLRRVAERMGDASSHMDTSIAEGPVAQVISERAQAGYDLVLMGERRVSGRSLPDMLRLAMQVPLQVVS